VAAWSGGATARVEAPTARTTTEPARPRRRVRARRVGLFGGVVWIVGLAVLLAGVVALNVAVLRLNVRLDELVQERRTLRAGNAALSAQLSSASATSEIETLARRRLGLVQAEPEQMTYVQLDPRAK
jgi:cell division protein FtsL